MKLLAMTILVNLMVISSVLADYPEAGNNATEMCEHHIDEYFFKSCLGKTRLKLSQIIGEKTCHSVQDEAFYHMCRADHGLGAEEKAAGVSKMATWCRWSQDMLEEQCITQYQVLN